MLWLWKPYLPLGKVVIVAGAPGNGKSQLTALMAAFASRGWFYPTDVPEPSRVLLLSAEDDPADTIVPRLIAVDADRSRVDYIDVLTELPDGLTSTGMIRIPGDVGAMHDYVRARPDARLLVMDPVASFFGRDHATTVNQDVRDALDPLASIARMYAVTIVLVLHLNKSESRDFAQRIAESHGFQAVARSVLALGPDPDDPEGERGASKILAVTKANLAGAGNHAVRCEIVAAEIHDDHGGLIETSELALRGFVNIAADELLMPASERGARWEARQWLADFLGDRWVLVSEVRKAALSDGIHWRTIERVRQGSGYQRSKQAGVKNGPWWMAKEGVPGTGGLGGLGGSEEDNTANSARASDPPYTDQSKVDDPNDANDANTAADDFLDEFHRWEQRRLGESDDDE